MEIAAVRGVIVEDGALLDTVRGAFSDETVFGYVTSGDGFYLDGSFVQHKHSPYNGGYGVGVLSRLSDLFYLLDVSPWEADSRSVYRKVYDSFEPFMWRGGISDAVRGRYLAFPDRDDHTGGHAVMGALLKLACSAPEEDALAFRRMVKHWILTDARHDFPAGESIPVISLARELMADDSVEPRGELHLNKVFGNMDRVMHRSEDWAFAISMNSSRIANYESINGMNVKGWYTADGMTYLYNDDVDQFGGHYWPTVDAHRMPDTTVDTCERERTSLTVDGAYKNPNDWVGGVELGDRYGAAGMKLDAEGSTLEAKKSWFMFNDEVVALGAGISSTDGRPIETVVENRKLDAAGDNAFTVDGRPALPRLGDFGSFRGASWAHLEGTGGYFFSGGTDLEAEREQREGRWTDINIGSGVSDRDETLSENYLTVWLDHDRNPEGGTYAYTLLPNASKNRTSSYAGSPEPGIVGNTATVQAVRENDLGLFGANFWEAGEMGYLSSDGPASVMVREGGQRLAVAISDPTQRGQTVTVALDLAARDAVSADERVRVRQLDPTVVIEVDVSGARGASQEVVLGYDAADHAQIAGLLDRLHADGEVDLGAYRAVSGQLTASERAHERGDGQAARSSGGLPRAVAAPPRARSGEPGRPPASRRRRRPSRRAALSGSEDPACLSGGTPG